MSETDLAPLTRPMSQKLWGDCTCSDSDPIRSWPERCSSALAVSDLNGPLKRCAAILSNVQQLKQCGFKSLMQVRKSFGRSLPPNALFVSARHASLYFVFAASRTGRCIAILFPSVIPHRGLVSPHPVVWWHFGGGLIALSSVLYNAPRSHLRISHHINN